MTNSSRNNLAATLLFLLSFCPSVVSANPITEAVETLYGDVKEFASEKGGVVALSLEIKQKLDARNLTLEDSEFIINAVHFNEAVLGHMDITQISKIRHITLRNESLVHLNTISLIDAFAARSEMTQEIDVRRLKMNDSTFVGNSISSGRAKR